MKPCIPGAWPISPRRLIALTEQKFHEMQEAAVRWGFSEDDVGLVTGNRKVNPDARVLVVVAEILLNRLLHPEGFDFHNVSAVVMDEFHTFNEPDRGIVWELSLALLPKHTRLLLLSATVGNAAEFIIWLPAAITRKLQLVQSTERKVPLQFHWVGDQLLNEQLEHMAQATRKPARRRPWCSASTATNAGASPSSFAGKACSRTASRKNWPPRSKSTISATGPGRSSNRF